METVTVTPTRYRWVCPKCHCINDLFDKKREDHCFQCGTIYFCKYEGDGVTFLNLGLEKFPVISKK